VLAGVLGRRRALKGFVGDVPATVAAGDELNLLNWAGSSAVCSGHHSSLDDAIKVKVIGLACDDQGVVKNIADVALPGCEKLGQTAPLVVIAGACMNSGKTYAATEIIQLGTRAGLRVAAAKLSGIACLRDTLNMADHGAIATASFLDLRLAFNCGRRRPGAGSQSYHRATERKRAGSDRDRTWRRDSGRLFRRVDF